MAELPLKQAALALNQRVQACIDKKDWRGAIQEVERLGDVRSNETLERELVRWRIAAFEQARPNAHPETWPPRFKDPFPDPHGVPELSPSDLSLPTLAGGMMHHGCILVRGLLDASEVECLRHDIDHAFEDQNAAAHDTQNLQQTPWYARLPVEATRQKDLPLSRIFVEGGHGVLTADSPRSLTDLVRIFENHGIPTLLESYFGERPALSVGKSTLRRIPPTLNASGWHQDGAFLGSGIRSMNAWISLSHCGEDASGLNLVPRRFNHIIETGTGNAPFSWAASDEAVRQASGEAGIVSPVFEPGDVLFFDHMLMHQTGIPTGMCKPRWAIESWFFAPTGYPMDQIPLYI